MDLKRIVRETQFDLLFYAILSCVEKNIEGAIYRSLNKEYYDKGWNEIQRPISDIMYEILHIIVDDGVKKFSEDES